MNRRLVFLVEGQAEKACLDALLPRLLPVHCGYRILSFRGKQDLEKSLTRTLRAYQHPQARFVILRDQDAGDCRRVKAHLVALAAASGDQRPVKIRVACRALEGWYLAQLAVVGEVFGLRNLGGAQVRAKFRDPDRLHRPDEELAALTHGRYQKVSGSARLGAVLNPAETRSASFANFVKAVKYLAELPE